MRHAEKFDSLNPCPYRAQLKADPMDLLAEKLARPSGLCTSVAKSKAENAARIKYILDAYLSGISLQRAARSADNWEHFSGLPMEFASYRYRESQ